MPKKQTAPAPSPRAGKMVLVTGGSGFIAAYCIAQLLESGYHVRTTIRTASREHDVREMLQNAGVVHDKNLSFAQADLMSDDGWNEAISGCDYVLHVASPFPLVMPKDEDELILPSVQGALRVLRFSRSNGVKRVVMTSSFAAIGYSPKENSEPYNEKDWTDPATEKITAYVKSKVIAERAAWDFIQREGGELELAVINPVGVMGPVLGKDYSTSIQLIQKLLDGSVPGCPRLSFGVVDVRDVADMHIRAMTNPAAKGERFLAISGDFMTIREMAQVLKTRLGETADKVPTREIPDWIVRIVALFDSSVRQILPELGHRKSATGEKAMTLLGWHPRSNEEAIVATAQSLIEHGIVKKRQ